ncbi:hypothetical protein [Nostoc sp.]
MRVRWEGWGSWRSKQIPQIDVFIIQRSQLSAVSNTRKKPRLFKQQP